MISALTARRPTSLSTTTADVSVVLRDTLARALYYEEAQMDLNATFAELGLDSVVAVEWIKEINQQLRTSLSTAVIYEYTTLQLLADHIAQSPLGGLPGETTEGIFAGAPPISSIQDDRKSEHLDVEGVFARVYSGELSVADALQTMRV
jgi:acyl carrier protein